MDPPDLPQLLQMRAEFKIDEVVAGAQDDYGRLKKLASWISLQWEHSTDRPTREDPITILREAKQGKRFPCVQYATVLAAAARAYDMPVRVIGLMPADVESSDNDHVVTEVWLATLNKFVLADGQYGTIAELDGKPLNAIELQNAINGCCRHPHRHRPPPFWLMDRRNKRSICRRRRRLRTVSPSRD